LRQRSFFQNKRNVFFKKEISDFLKESTCSLRIGLVKTNYFFTGTISTQSLLLEQLRERARHVDYNANRLAEDLHMSRNTLFRRFYELCACAPGEWLAEQRIHDAKVLLERGYTVKEVSVALGFQQSPQFCREFRRRVGCTPSNYVSEQSSQPKLVLQLAKLQPLVQTANLLAQTANAPRLRTQQAA